MTDFCARKASLKSQKDKKHKGDFYSVLFILLWFCGEFPAFQSLNLFLIKV